MIAIGSGTAGKRTSVKKKPYVMKVDEETGSLYLERERHPFLDELPYVTALVIAVFFALISCFQYIHLRTDVANRIRQTEALERQFQALRSENILTESEVRRTPDLDSIYETAVSELGMVPATEANVLIFERTNSEFVYQRDNIPNFGF